MGFGHFLYMNILFSLLSANYLIIIAALIFLTILLSAGFIFLLWQTFNIQKRLKKFFSGRRAKDLEEVIAQQIKRQIKSENEIKELFQSSRDLWKIANKSVQKVGIVRFNPFKDTGGDQSFAIALLDLKDSGIVISSLYSREGTRVYSKPIEKGRSKYQLTEEEKKAIEKAKK
jgi:hypothetical protein